jgi:crotonobetainyl-CoA:carnitine CoA-transferase CaiB-like acyl-CoA transferase
MAIAVPSVGFLDGVTVVDATRLLPGGYATMLLSDMGAKVIKVEQPGLGDYMRATPPTRDGRSPVHETINRNKLSIGINLKSSSGKEVLRRLIKESDVFVEGFRPGAMKRLGLSFENVRKMNSRIVYCSVSAFGNSNSLSAVPGHDINFQAMAGTLSYSEGSVPLLQLSDMVAGMNAALAITGALARRKEAVYIDVPIVQSLLAWMVIPASVYIATGDSPAERQSLLFGSTPYYNLYKTSDSKFIAVAAIEDQFWHNLVVSLGVPDLETKRFGSSAERKQVSLTLKRVFASKTRDEWSELLLKRETCATPVLSVKEALTSDWSKASSMLVNVRGNGTVLAGPVRASPRPRDSAFTKAPFLGEDTGSIMKTMGYSKTEVARLMQQHVIE